MNSKSNMSQGSLHKVLCGGAFGLYHMAYREWGDPANPRVLLCVHGLTRNSLDFERMAQSLSSRYRVIAPDVVGRGESDSLVDPMGYNTVTYAADMITLIAHLNVPQVDWLGTSMGGMIAQIVAAKYRDRVRSLVSIMSSSGDPRLPSAKPRAMAALLAPRPGAENRERVIKHGMNIYRIIGSPGFPTSDAELRAKIEQAADRSYYPAGVARQMVAILASGSRAELLSTISAPTLVLHGADDPLVPVEAGVDTARRVPGARLQIIPGMGHDLAPGLVPILAEAIADHCLAADRQFQPALS